MFSKHSLDFVYFPNIVLENIYHNEALEKKMVSEQRVSLYIIPSYCKVKLGLQTEGVVYDYSKPALNCCNITSRKAAEHGD